MVFIQDFFCLVQINFSRFLCLPGKTCGKVQIIVQHAILMAVFSFLLHAVQHLFSFFACFLIHAGFLDFLLETAHIRNILRMHFVQLLLKKFDLLPDSGLPVNFLIGVLLRSLSLLTDTENLHQLIDSLFHQMHAFFPGIHLDHMVFFFPGKAHVTSQGTDGFRIAFPMVDHAAYPDAPLKAFCKIHQFFLDLIKFLLFFFRGDILDIRKIYRFCLNHAVSIFYMSHLHSSSGSNLDAAFLVYILNDSHHAHWKNIFHGNFLWGYFFLL